MDLLGQGVYEVAAYEDSAVPTRNSHHLHRGSRLYAARVLDQGALEYLSKAMRHYTQP